jgi:hypothetical protein
VESFLVEFLGLIWSCFKELFSEFLGSLFVDVFWFRDGLHSVLFWLYSSLLAIYMRNFTYLCIMVWIHTHTHTHTYIHNLNILCICLSTDFLVQFFSSFGMALVFGVNQFNHWSDFNNSGHYNYILLHRMRGGNSKQKGYN